MVRRAHDSNAWSRQLSPHRTVGLTAYNRRVKESYDVIIIGTGQAGPALAVRMAGAGQRVAIIERSRFGGTCVNTGCIPTKTLVASAYAAHMARRALEFGVQLEGSVSVDMKRVEA